jgi:hypothetical protein
MARPSNPSAVRRSRPPPRIGLVVAFARLARAERDAIELAWDAATSSLRRWKPGFVHVGTRAVPADSPRADLIVYLGESSRFRDVAGAAARSTPVMLVKSTVEELLVRPPDTPPRYRMCTGVNGIGHALAAAVPRVPSVDWTTLPWPRALAPWTTLGAAEQSYVETSVAAFRAAAARRGIPWRTGPPARRQPFSVFLTMHDPAAATLAEAALELWPQCTVLTADGMVATHAPSGRPWPSRVLRVRHWSPHSRSRTCRLFRAALAGRRVPDFDSAGMLFGTLVFLDFAFGTGAESSCLQGAGARSGPLGLMRLTAAGRPQPERLVVFRGEEPRVVTVRDPRGRA